MIADMNSVSNTPFVQDYEFLSISDLNTYYFWMPNSIPEQEGIK
jgi:hypothetical protein